jgi:hypothetical protein
MFFISAAGSQLPVFAIGNVEILRASSKALLPLRHQTSLVHFWETFEVRGSKPDANAIAGIVYIIHSDTLRAIRFPDSATRASLQ